jgi:hypothetical protein
MHALLKYVMAGLGTEFMLWAKPLLELTVGTRTKSGDARETHVYIKGKSQGKYITAAKLGDSVLKNLYTIEPKFTRWLALVSTLKFDR